MKLTPEQEEKIVKLYKEGWGVNALTGSYQVGYKNLKEILERHGVKMHGSVPLKINIVKSLGDLI